jgi:hypothetical protein
MGKVKLEGAHGCTRRFRYAEELTREAIQLVGVPPHGQVARDLR